MPSPFPGMDPYLEHPGRWAGLHNAIAVNLAQVISPRLPDRYIVSVEERVYLAEAPDFVGRADAAVVERPRSPRKNGSATPPARIHETARGVQVLTATLPVPDRIHEVFLEVREAGTEDVITVIELLSPTNKVPGHGRREYEEKRFTILGTRTTLVEIDLVRAGQPMPAYVRDYPAGAPLGDYRILIARGHRRPYADVYAFSVRAAIPVFPLPLGPQDEELPVDLQPIIDGLYDGLRVGRRIDYGADPVPPLSPSDASWADTLLREAGLR